MAAADPPVTDGRWSYRRLATAVSTGRGVLYGPRHVTLIVFAILVFGWGIGGSSTVRYGLVLSTVYAIAILGTNAIHAAFGELNLGAGAFMAVGAYTTGYALNHGVPFIAAALLAVALAAAIGCILAIPTTRLNGLAIALVTFALAYSLNDLVGYLEKFTGGAAGMSVPATSSFAGLIFSGSETGMLLLAVVVFVLVGVLHLYLLNHRPGRVAIMVGESELAAVSFGSSAHWVKIAVWTWSAAVAGLAGALYALTIGYLSAEQWLVSLSIFIFVGGLVGGTRSVVGAWLGGILVGGLQLWLQLVVPAATTTIVFGVILYLALIAGGKGLAEQLERLSLQIARRLGRVR